MLKDKNVYKRSLCKSTHRLKKDVNYRQKSVQEWIAADNGCTQTSHHHRGNIVLWSIPRKHDLMLQSRGSKAMEEERAEVKCKYPGRRDG